MDCISTIFPFSNLLILVGLEKLLYLILEASGEDWEVLHQRWKIYCLCFVSLFWLYWCVDTNSDFLLCNFRLIYQKQKALEKYYFIFFEMNKEDYAMIS